MEIAAAALLVLVATMHSVLGERYVLPALEIAGTGPRLSARRTRSLVRGCWHLTSVAWIALAATLLGGAPPAAVVAGTCLVSGVVVFACVPGHVAWPVFTAAGLLALAATDAVPRGAVVAVVVVAAVTAAGAAGIHLAWAFGSRRGIDAVLPQRGGTDEPLVRPGPVPTAAVAVALLVYVAVLAGLVLGAAGWWWTACGVAALAVMVLRVVGDGRYVGVCKRVRDTPFARADDRCWTPVVALLGVGAAGALVLG